MTSELVNFFTTRRSGRARDMSGPGPDAGQLDAILTLAARVPDHGKLAPFRFIRFTGEARGRFGKKLAELFLADWPETRAEGIRFEQQRFERAPVVVAVISTADIHPKIPVWEQQLCAGAVCYNLLLAANAQGFAAQWLTEWPAFHDGVKAELSLEAHERVAGFIYMGQAPVQDDRPRPDMSTIVSDY